MPLLPLTTDRLTLRMMRPADAPALAAYRNRPEVARHQSWSLPYGLDQAESMLRSMEHLDGPTPDEWVQIAVLRDGAVIGDVAVKLTGTEIATVGYTMAPEWQGHGYAAEAVAAVVDGLVAGTRVHRIEADTDPVNFSSMRVIEQLGFRYEGTARKVSEVDGEWLDEARFGLLREDHLAWRQRPRSRPDVVELVEVTEANLDAVRMLATFHYQEQFVAPVPKSLAQALVPPSHLGETVVPWFRAVVADGTVVGFVMLAEGTEGHPQPYLWRLLIDRVHQRRRIGERVIELLIERLRADGHHELRVGWVEGVGGPAQFYERLGFVRTGMIDDDGEVEASLPF